MNADQMHAHVVDLYYEHLNPSLAKLMGFAGFGLEDHADGCYVVDHEGKSYLDCLGGYGVFSLGHRHPRVVAAVKAQLDRMPLGSKVFFNPVQAELAGRLASIAPGKLEFSFFCNSGAEACEAALKFAKGATRRTKIVSTLGGFHGKTLGALSTTGKEKYRAPYNPLIPGVEFVPFGNLNALSAIDSSTAAFIVEPIQGEGGIHIAPNGYLAAAREACDRSGALLIFDEVQTGMGRTGTMFGCEHDGVAPDLMTLAKALGGGVMPIGALLGTAEIWERIYGENPLSHTSTFGGNALACAAALAAIDATLEENLPANATKMGALLMDGLDTVRSKHPELVSEVRGRGLMIGVEFAMDEVGELVIGQMTKRGVIAAYTLNNPRVIRFEPPLIMKESQVDEAVGAFSGAVAETSEILASLV